MDRVLLIFSLLSHLHILLLQFKILPLSASIGYFILFDYKAVIITCIWFSKYMDNDQRIIMITAIAIGSDVQYEA
jgi:hypothetical protein